MEKEIKDNHGRVIGRIYDQGHQIIIKNEHGSSIGFYRKNENATYDSSGRRVGSGNLLETLVKK